MTIPETALFRTFGCLEGIRARYPDGTQFPTVVPNTADPKAAGHPAAADIALRFVNLDWELRAWLYVLGTEEDAKDVLRHVDPTYKDFDKAAFKRIVDAS